MKNDDVNYCHPHPALATARKYIESKIYNHLGFDENAYEIAASSRTIEYNHNRTWLNRPIVTGFNGDAAKYNKLYNLRRDVGMCSCPYSYCEHKDSANINTIYSVDTIYYLWKTIIQEVQQAQIIYRKIREVRPGFESQVFITHEFAEISLLGRRHLHVLHLPKKEGYAKFHNDEGYIIYTAETNELIMDTKGNEVSYKHKMYVNAERPYLEIKHIDKKNVIAYLNFKPLETIDTGATIYGLFELICEKAPQEPVGKRGIVRILPPPEEVEEMQENIDISNAISIDIADGLPKKKGIYKVKCDADKEVFAKVINNEGAMITFDSTEPIDKWSYIKVENFNSIIRGVVNAAIGCTSREQLKIRVQKIVTSTITSGTMNADKFGELVHIAVEHAAHAIKKMNAKLTDANLDRLMGVETNYYKIFALLFVIIDAVLYSYIGFSFTVRLLFAILLIIASYCTIPIMLGVITVYYVFKLDEPLTNTTKAMVVKYKPKPADMKTIKICFLLLIIIGPSIVLNARKFDNKYTESILDNCHSEGFVEVFGVHNRKEFYHLFREARAGSQVKDPTEVTKEVNNCIDYYEACLQDDMCYYRVISSDVLKNTKIIIINIIFILTVFILFVVGINFLFLFLSSLYRILFTRAGFSILCTILVYICLLLPKAKTNPTDTNVYKKNFESQCAQKKQTEIPMSEDIVWKVKDLKGKPYKYDSITDCNCGTTEVKKKTMQQTDSRIPNDKTPIIYHACWWNNISALIRNAWQMPRATVSELEKFGSWFNRIIQKEIKPMLIDFEYSPISWFNHLNLKKQNEVRQYYMDTDDGPQKYITSADYNEMITYTNFVKSEKQIGLDAKTRCICSPCAAYKYLAGPVTYALEQVFKKNFKGYQVPLTWKEQEAALNDFEDRGLTTTIQLDGKGFDLTQSWDIKNIVDLQIYGLIKDKVTHVDSDLFINTITPEWRIVKPSCIIDGKVKTFGSVKIRGKTFSGSCDTTLMNTIRMSCYIRYAVENYVDCDYEVWVKGDDTVIFVNDLNANKILKAIEKVFCTEEQWKENYNIEHGLGQIAKFVKVGKIVDFDFCSTMAIKTHQHGYKIIRKLENIVQKEHLSVKILQLTPESYHNELLISARAWLGTTPNIVSKYFEKVHPYTPNIKPINKLGKAKTLLETLEDEPVYQNQLINYNFEVLEERQSDTPDRKSVV